MAVNLTPGFDLQPSAQQVPVSTNYINNFDFLNQYLPDTYEKEFERYGNRTIASFLRMVGAEMPSNSDLIKWAEQGRLHIKYTGCTSGQAAAAVEGTWTIPNANFNPALGSQNTSALRVGQTVMISDKTPGSNLSNKGIVKTASAAGGAQTVVIAYYEAGGQAMGNTAECDIFIYGSEFNKGTNTISPSFGLPVAVSVALLATWSSNLLLDNTSVVSSLISKPNLLMISFSPANPSVVSKYISSKYESSNLLDVSSPKTKSLFTSVRGR